MKCIGNFGPVTLLKTSLLPKVAIIWRRKNTDGKNGIYSIEILEEALNKY